MSIFLPPFATWAMMLSMGSASLAQTTSPVVSDDWTAPYRRLEVPAHPNDLTSRMLAAGKEVLLEGDVLTFLHRSAAAEVRLLGGIQLPLARIPGTDLWMP